MAPLRLSLTLLLPLFEVALLYYLFLLPKTERERKGEEDSKKKSGHQKENKSNRWANVRANAMNHLGGRFRWKPARHLPHQLADLPLRPRLRRPGGTLRGRGGYYGSGERMSGEEW
jgi:hypothetical protein